MGFCSKKPEACQISVVLAWRLGFFDRALDWWEEFCLARVVALCVACLESYLRPEAYLDCGGDCLLGENGGACLNGDYCRFGSTKRVLGPSRLGMG